MKSVYFTVLPGLLLAAFGIWGLFTSSTGDAGFGISLFFTLFGSFGSGFVTATIVAEENRCNEVLNKKAIGR